MLKEVSSKEFKHQFKNDPHPFISEAFIEHNKYKVDKIIRLIQDDSSTSFGFVAGVKDSIVQSPFSAPFGGFHFRHHYQYVKEIDDFIESLIEYFKLLKIREAQITLPPDIYHQNFNAKMVNVLIRHGFSLKLPNITNWINLYNFDGGFSQRDSRTYLNQAIRNCLEFNIVNDRNDHIQVFDLIYENRTRLGRPIYMTLEEIDNMSDIWPVDYFRVNNVNGQIIAGAIFYRAQPEIAYAVFWGDNEIGRPLRSMDFLVFNLIMYYKTLGYKYIDLGISTENGIPNNGLLRFKETHDCSSSLRFTFNWSSV